MTSSKPTIVILGGGWHQPESYSKLTHALSSQGFDVQIPRYSSMNQSHPPNGNLVTDTFQIRKFVETLADEGREIVVLMHSYGGHVGTNALCELGLDTRASQTPPKRGGISHLMFVCAYALTEGKPMFWLVQKMGDAELMSVAFGFDHDNTCIANFPELLIGGYDNADETKEYLATFRPWNGACMYEPIQRCAWKEIPATYVHTTEDKTLPMKYQQAIVEGMQNVLKDAGKELRIVELATGHCPNLTATQDLADVIFGVATGKN